MRSCSSTSLSRPRISASETSGTRRPRMVATPAPPRCSSVTLSPLARTISSIAERGMAKCWPAIETVSAGMMVSVSGTRRVMRVPSPSLLSTSTMPPIRSTFERTTSMPTPRPEMAVTSLAVDRPASKISASCSRGDELRRVVLRRRRRRRSPSRPASCRRCRGRRRGCRSGSGCPTGAPRPTGCRSRACRP